MKGFIDFLKKQPLLTGILGVTFIGGCIRVLGPRMVGDFEAGAIRLAFALSGVVFLYLISRDKAFEKSNNKTFYVMLVLLPTLFFPLLISISQLAHNIINKTPLADNWFISILIITFEYLCVGLVEEITSRGLINDSILYQFRNSKISTKKLFIIIAIADVIVFGAIHLIGSNFSSPTAAILGIIKTLSSGIGGLAYLFLYWKTRNLWAVSIIHGLFDYILDIPVAMFRKVGEVASTTQDYVGMQGSDVTSAIVVQLIVILIDVIICVWIWKKHMKDVDFEEIRQTW